MQNKENHNKQNHDELHRLHIRFHRNPILHALISHLMAIPELNRRLDTYHQAISESGKEEHALSLFLQLSLEELETSWELNDPSNILQQIGEDRAEDPEQQPPVLVVSNHPLGGRDGLALISCMHQLYGAKYFKALVNEFLLHLPYLCEILLPISPLKMKSSKKLEHLHYLSQDLGTSLSGHKALLVFPAGLCSRWHTESLSIKSEWAASFPSLPFPSKAAAMDKLWQALQQVYDLPWRHSFLRLARKHKLPVLPLHISGQNSPRFYHLARLRKCLGLRFNWEMLLLPRELLYNRNRTASQEKCRLQITPGALLSVEALAQWPAKADQFWAQLHKHYIYQLPIWLRPGQQLGGADRNLAQENMNLLQEAVGEMAEQFQSLQQ